MSEFRYVLDASALIALLRVEDGADRVAAALPDAAIGAVNFSEVIAKFQERGATDATLDALVADMEIPVLPFDLALADAAGRLRSRTRSSGLSLGDRACLALARQLGAIVLTADRAWAALDLDVNVELIR